MSNRENQPLAASGAGYFFKGFELIKTKGLRRFVLIPLSVNLTLFSVAFYYLFQQIGYYMQYVEAWLPEWLSWLSFVLWPFALVTVVVTFSFIFSSVANWIAAPFNGLLAEKVEASLSNVRSPDDGITAIVKDLPRTIGREWTKFSYYFPRAIGFLLISWLVPVIGQIIWFLFLAWMMAIQYKDYAFDNHKVPFSVMRQALADKKGLSYSFGITVTIFSMIPIINLIVMPVAICGATALWVDHYQKQFSSTAA